MLLFNAGLFFIFKLCPLMCGCGFFGKIECAVVSRKHLYVSRAPASLSQLQRAPIHTLLHIQLFPFVIHPIVDLFESRGPGMDVDHRLWEGWRIRERLSCVYKKEIESVDLCFIFWRFIMACQYVHLKNNVHTWQQSLECLCYVIFMRSWWECSGVLHSNTYLPYIKTCFQ